MLLSIKKAFIIYLIFHALPMCAMMHVVKFAVARPYTRIPIRSHVTSSSSKDSFESAQNLRMQFPQAPKLGRGLHAADFDYIVKMTAPDRLAKKPLPRSEDGLYLEELKKFQALFKQDSHRLAYRKN